MKKVAILMSTYNGERYIEEQLQSIINQTYENIDIYIRDDCSTDGTVKIIEKYTSCKNLHFIKGVKNMGYPEGFYYLMSQEIEADYFSFSDQDDVWEPQKIERAVQSLEKLNQDIPLLYFSAYELCDQYLKPIKVLPNINFEPSFRNSLFQCLALGYTMVMNNKAKDICVTKRSIKTISKDVWIGMICSGLGEIIFDRRSCAKYRRNDGAFSISDTNFLVVQKERFYKLFKGNGFDNITKLLSEFYEVFSEDLSLERKKELELFLPGKYKIRKTIKKIFYPNRLRYSLIDEIMLRFMFLLGRL
ncbi:glycosyltransferase family 2 protein [Enterococcus raffinosus]|uniref:glycosyltransferase family 2 protein n=1 Tax=Enterococcus raffinosus TaxID=71452 RepID=UPI001C11BE4F|nr:glycosyltransferase family 2 protein [Enterococcus raffinosus]MBU5362212.1 glycosyltransferase family 2 protein [Enterococcus raffinosus]